MNIELVVEDPEVPVPEKFYLTDFSNGSAVNGCTVQIEIYEKWLPKPKEQATLNWILKEILDETKEESEEDTGSKTGDPSKKSLSHLRPREYCLAPIPEENREHHIDISCVIYPIVDDPHTMGRIACTALLNKMFAMRIFLCSRVIFMLGVCEKWSQSEQDMVEKEAFNGFKQKAQEADVRVDESQVHTETLCMLGGVLTITQEVSCYPNNSVIGDVIVLTKPLGVLLALHAYKIFKRNQTDLKDRLCRVISEEDLTKAYDAAIKVLSTFNSHAIRFTEGMEVRAATEINGQSLMQQAQFLVEQQKNELSFYIYNLPLISKMLLVSKVLGYQIDLIQGNLPEICGGLLLVMPREQAANYCRHMLHEGNRAWIIGVVETGQRTANMIKKARVIDWNCKTEIQP